jgi:hypothetical protein
MSKPVPAPLTATAARQPLPATVEAPASLPRAVADSLYRTLRQKGFTAQQIVSVSSELIGLVTADLSPDSTHLRS